MINLDDYLTPSSAAELLGVGGAAVRTWVREGKLPAVQVGGRYLIRRDDVSDFIKPV